MNNDGGLTCVCDFTGTNPLGSPSLIGRNPLIVSICVSDGVNF